MSIFQKAYKDYFTAKFLGLCFITVFVPFIILGMLLIFGGKEIFDILSTQNVSDGVLSEHPFLLKLLHLSITKWIIATFFYTIGGYLIVLFSLVIAMITLGFLTPFVVTHLHKKYYQNKLINPMSLVASLKMSLKIIFKFLLLLIVTLPFFFIPFLINISFFYLFYKFMTSDVASNMMSQKQFDLLQQKYKFKLIFTCFIFYLLSIIPIVGIFLQLFFVIYFTHLFFDDEMYLSYKNI